MQNNNTVTKNKAKKKFLTVVLNLTLIWFVNTLPQLSLTMNVNFQLGTIQVSYSSFEYSLEAQGE